MISFIIPVYNKGSVLYETLSSLIKELNHTSYQDFEIIVVSDGSTDNSLEEAVRFRKFNGSTDKIKIFYYTQNIGKGFAERFGFDKSSGETIAFLDGDMDISANQIINALQIFQKEQPDMVIGSKYHRQSRIYYSAKRYLYSVLLKLTNRLLFNLNVTDSQVGLKIFQRGVLEEILPRIVVKRFAADLELLVVAQKLGFTAIIESPVIIHQTSLNQSTVTFTEVKNFCQDIAAIFYRATILRYYTRAPRTLTFPIAIHSV